jgi:hypothetical protein
MRQAHAVSDGVKEAGATPREFCTITVTDGIAMGHEGMRSSLVSREVIADSVELTMRGHAYDALVGLAGCDKSLPGMMMAMLRLNVPSVFLYGGSILPGVWRGREVNVRDLFEGVGQHEEEGDMLWENVLLTRKLIEGLTATGRWGSEANAWERIVRPAMLALNPPPVYRVDEYTMIFEVPAAPLYDIEAPETLLVVVPPEVVLAEAEIIADPPVFIKVVPGTAALDGSLVCRERGYYTAFVVPSPPPPLPPPFVENLFLSPPPSSPPAMPPAPTRVGGINLGCNNTERGVRKYTQQLIIELSNDSYIPILASRRGVPQGEADMVLAGLVASSWLHANLNVSEQEQQPLLARGWNLVVQPALRVLPPPPPPPLPAPTLTATTRSCS